MLFSYCSDLVAARFYSMLLACKLSEVCVIVLSARKAVAGGGAVVLVSSLPILCDKATVLTQL